MFTKRQGKKSLYEDIFDKSGNCWITTVMDKPFRNLGKIWKMVVDGDTDSKLAKLSVDRDLAEQQLKDVAKEYGITIKETSENSQE